MNGDFTCVRERVRVGEREREIEVMIKIIKTEI